MGSAVAMRYRRNIGGLGSRALAQFAFFARCTLAAFLGGGAYYFALGHLVGPRYYSESSAALGPMAFGIGQTVGGYHTSGGDYFPRFFAYQSKLMRVTCPARGVG